ncbi:MAG: hypothetical protein ACI8QC_001937 [Planctomycetota bacterium]|jgi:uncharacterized protein (DUF1800 family)
MTHSAPDPHTTPSVDLGDKSLAITAVSQQPGVSGKDSSGAYGQSSRRALLGLGGAAAVLASAPEARAQAAQIPLAGGANTQYREDLGALISRGTYGYKVGDLQLARQLGFSGWLDDQLNPVGIDDSALDARLAQFPTLTMTGKQIYDTYSGTISLQQVPRRELREATLLRRTFSKRQLLERVVEFWTDHFNIQINELKRDTVYLKPVEDRDVIRPLALGNFRDLLFASAHSAAMCAYLDNKDNKVGAPQENYAREVMELHTIGVAGGYTEDDVRELARCFTGWNYFEQSSPVYGDFRFIAGNHDNGSKQVLGINIPAGGGVLDAETILEFLANSPQTAEYVSGKLTRYLLSYDPPQFVLDAVKNAWIASSGDIKTVIRAILNPANLAAADVFTKRKLKRPYHYVVSALRAMDADLVDTDLAIDELHILGHTPYDWGPPTGYPDTREAWVGGMWSRWRMAIDIPAGLATWCDVTPQLLALVLGSTPRSKWALRIFRRLTGGWVSLNEVQKVQDYINANPQMPTSELAAEAYGLALLSPIFQTY